MSNYKRKSAEERRSEILEAATAIFLEKGYLATTMEDIIAETTLSKGGFYHYYNNTREIMTDLIRQKNYNDLGNSERLFEARTKEELRRIIADIFVDRMFDDSPQHKLHLMMAYELVYDDAFLALYQEQEQETLTFLVEAVRNVDSATSLSVSDPELLLLYRINNTLHFVENLYSNKQEFGLNREVLFNFYYDMLKKLIS